METTAFVITIWIWGTLSLGGILLSFFSTRSFIHDRKWGYILLAVFGLIITIISLYNLYVVINKDIARPIPANTKEVNINGITYIQYQDSTHMCNASDKNSTVFTSLVPTNGEVTKTDTCIICGKRFVEHNTHSEQMYFDWLEELSFIPNY